MSIDSSARYQENKERLRKSLWNVSRSFWRIKKRKWDCGCEWYKNLPEHEKQRLARWAEKKYKYGKIKLLH